MENNISQKHIKMENKKAVKLTDFQKNEENPFMKQAIEGIENHVVKKYKSNSGGDKRAVVALADTETGEVFKTSFIRQIEVDEEQFTKLYLSNFAAFFDLSQAAIRVFGYFMTCMKPKNDLIIFNRKKCLEYTKYKTDKAVYKGLAELVKAEIIARGPADNLWFINPLIVFNGDRVTFAKTYVPIYTHAAWEYIHANRPAKSPGVLENPPQPNKFYPISTQGDYTPQKSSGNMSSSSSKSMVSSSDTSTHSMFSFPLIAHEYISAAAREENTSCIGSPFSNQ